MRKYSFKNRAIGIEETEEPQLLGDNFYQEIFQRRGQRRELLYFNCGKNT